jgi:hypothetical protein
MDHHPAWHVMLESIKRGMTPQIHAMIAQRHVALEKNTRHAQRQPIHVQAVMPDATKRPRHIRARHAQCGRRVALVKSKV